MLDESYLAPKLSRPDSASRSLPVNLCVVPVSDGLPTRLREMELRYRLTCPECGNKFWAERKLIKTSGFDGSFKGFRCPLNSCGALVPWEEKK